MWGYEGRGIAGWGATKGGGRGEGTPGGKWHRRQQEREGIARWHW